MAGGMWERGCSFFGFINIGVSLAAREYHVLLSQQV